MNVLLMGSGGREHAMAVKILESKKIDRLFVAPGNAGTAEIAKNLPISVSDFEGLKTAAIQHKIDLVVVGPEVPLVEGIHDFFLADPELENISVMGPEKLGSQLEASKEFAKEFMARHHIPTAKYASFTKDTLEEGLNYLETVASPYVLKADGLAAGKGVLILDSLEDARNELRAMLADAKFGQASAKVVIEEFLEGIELSCFVLTDGKSYKLLPFAKDYKRIGEGDTGLNTGGMGAISPVPFVDKAFERKIEDTIVKPTIDGLRKDNIPYKGFIFIGLIKVQGAPKVIEYNVRMGDPETEVVFPRIKNDILELFEAVSEGRLSEIDLEIDERYATTVIAVSGGYPEAYEKAKPISGLENVQDSLVFHAGTKKEDKSIATDGGRVLAITALGETMKAALETSYKNLSKIDFEGMYYRKDIGFDL